MIRRIRSRAGLFMCAGLVLGGWSLAAKATQPVTQSEMRSFVYATLAVAAIAVISGTAGGTALVLKLTLDADRQHAKESREQILKVVTNNTEAMEAAIKALAVHNDSGDAHPVALKLHLDPVREKLGDHETRLQMLDLKLECEREKRNPKDSPYRRRASDPEGFDATAGGAPLRGKKTDE